MAKYYGKIGFLETAETVPGVWSEQITERYYYGDVIRKSLRWQTSDKVNDDLNISNQFSIVADTFAITKLNCMRYLEWMGVLWKITDIDVQLPRLILSVGGVWNGQTY